MSPDCVWDASGAAPPSLTHKGNRSSVEGGAGGQARASTGVDVTHTHTVSLALTGECQSATGEGQDEPAKWVTHGA